MNEEDKKSASATGAIDDGGPAFPSEQGHTPDGKWNQTYIPGMSLRDWFAGQALVGVLNWETATTPYERAKCAYAQADAMLRARKGGNQ